MVEHHDSREHDGRGVGDALTSNAGFGGVGTSVNRLEEGVATSDAGAGGDTFASHETGTQVGDDVAEEVGRDDDIEHARAKHQLHGQGVDVHVVALDVGEVCADAVEHAFEQLTHLLEDVGLERKGDRSATLHSCQKEGLAHGGREGIHGVVAEDANATSFVENLCPARVEPFAGLADEDDVETFLGLRDPGQVPDGSDARRETERESHLNVHAAEAAVLGGVAGTLEPDAMFAQEIQGFRRKGGSCVLEAGQTRSSLHPVDGSSRDEVDDLTGDRHDLAADPVTLDVNDFATVFQLRPLVPRQEAGGKVLSFLHLLCNPS